MHVAPIQYPLLVCLLLASTLVQADGEDPRDSTIGAIHILTNTQYASATLDGQSAEPEFVNDGKTVIIGRVDRTQPHVVVINGTMGATGSATVKVRARDFKLIRVAKNVKEWRAVKKVRLKKSKVKKQPKDDTPEEPPTLQPVPDDDEED
jgi:hypothetical protein